MEHRIKLDSMNFYDARRCCVIVEPFVEFSARHFSVPALFVCCCGVGGGGVRAVVHI